MHDIMAAQIDDCRLPCVNVMVEAVEGHVTKDPGMGGIIEEGQCRLSFRVSEENFAGHRAGLDTTLLSLPRRIISIRYTTQHHHMH